MDNIFKAMEMMRASRHRTKKRTPEDLRKVAEKELLYSRDMSFLYTDMNHEHFQSMQRKIDLLGVSSAEDLAIQVIENNLFSQEELNYLHDLSYTALNLLNDLTDTVKEHYLLNNWQSLKALAEHLYNDEHEEAKRIANNLYTERFRELFDRSEIQNIYILSQIEKLGGVLDEEQQNAGL